MPADREIEAKYRLAHPADLRAALSRGGASLLSHVFEQNTLFDTPDGRLRANQQALRLRHTRSLAESPGVTATILTYKGPRDADPELARAGIKSREEIELTLSAGAPLIRILARLGLQPAIHYEKRRATWRLAAAEVTIDELPRLGWFCEIEAPDVPTIHHVRDQLGLPADAAVAESYVALTAQHGTRSATGVLALCFDESTVPHG